MPQDQELQDKTIVCVDCSEDFVFTAGEQKFFASKGLTNEPKRCLPCRKAKKERNEKSDQGRRR